MIFKYNVLMGSCRTYIRSNCCMWLDREQSEVT
uniref:Uncharacterized protein n=1 Tax=Anguilla anguilla TaxID=7936 RepID=A0A0E9SZM9_ANGAN